MNTFENTEKLMAFANNELFGDEKMQLEEEIKNDPKFAEEFKKHLLAQELLESFISKDLKKKLNSLAESEVKCNSKGSFIRKLNTPRFKLAIAASIALVLSISSYLFLGNQYNYLNLAVSYLPEMSTIRGTNLDNQDILSVANDYFLNKEFDKAVQVLATITPDDDRYFLSQLIIGYAHLENDMPNKAVPAFQNCTSSNQENIKLEGEYGYLLCQLKLGVWMEENQKSLLYLSKTESFKYQKEATNLLNKLNIAKYFN